MSSKILENLRSFFTEKSSTEEKNAIESIAFLSKACIFLIQINML